MAASSVSSAMIMVSARAPTSRPVSAFCSRSFVAKGATVWGVLMPPPLMKL